MAKLDIKNENIKSQEKNDFIYIPPERDCPNKNDFLFGTPREFYKFLALNNDNKFSLFSFNRNFALILDKSCCVSGLCQIKMTFYLALRETCTNFVVKLTI